MTKNFIKQAIHKHGFTEENWVEVTPQEANEAIIEALTTQRDEMIEKIKRLTKIRYRGNYDGVKWGENYTRIDNLARDAYNQALTDVLALLREE